MLEDGAQTSLRDDLDAAMESAEPIETPAPAPAEAPRSETTTSERVRNERGQFARADSAQPKESSDGSWSASMQGGASEAPPVGAAPEAAPTERKRPQSWKKDYWDKFDQLPQDVADYILEREEQFTRGVSAYKQQADAYRPLAEAVAPYQQHIAQYGINPQQAVQRLLGTHMTLLNASPEQKAQHFKQLAEFYGVNYGDGQGQGQGQVDPVTNALWREVQQLRGQWGQYQARAQQAQAQQAVQQVTKFSEGRPHFDKLRDTMADLIERGFASTLEEAYDKASRLNDEVWQQRSAEQQAAGQKRVAAQSARAKAAAVQPRSGSPTAPQNGRENSLRGLLSEALDMHAGKV